jgi:DNA-binding IscR family transcriptional regulator
MRHAPGLALTLPQTARLFNLPPDACERLIAALADEGLLHIRPDGRIVSTPV